MIHPLANVCLAKDAVSGAQIHGLVRNLGITPTRVELGGRPQSLADGLSKLNDLAIASNIHVSDATLTLEAGGVGRASATQLVVQGSDLDRLRSSIETSRRWAGFTVAYLGDSEDAYLQSETSVKNLAQRNIDVDALPKKRGGLFPWESAVVDITQNPGRRVPWNGMWLWAASEIWFGPPALHWFPPSRLRACASAESVSQVDDCVHVELFPFDWYGKRRDEIRRRQTELRQLLDWDRLEEEPDRDAGDPQVEFEVGDGGKARRVTLWLGVDRETVVPRSRASWRRVAIVDERGQVTRSETSPA